MKYLVFPADKEGVCVKGFCPTICRSLSTALSEAYRQHRDLPNHHITYDRVNISKVND